MALPNPFQLQPSRTVERVPLNAHGGTPPVLDAAGVRGRRWDRELPERGCVRLAVPQIVVDRKMSLNGTAQFSARRRPARLRRAARQQGYLISDFQLLWTIHSLLGRG